MSGGGSFGCDWEGRELTRIRRVFPAKFEQVLSRLRLTQGEFAEKAGVNANSVSAWIRGRRLPRVTQLCLMAKGLGVSVDFLLDNASSRAPDLTEADREVLQYVAVEHGRGHSPSVAEVQEAFEGTLRRSWVSRLVALGLLDPMSVCLTSAGRREACGGSSLD